MSIQSSKDAISLIVNYVTSESTNYAILIDGEWGCGKTYFVKKELVDELHKINCPKSDNTKYTTIYLSLNGMKSTSEISSQLYLSIFHLFKKNEELSKLEKKIIPLSGAALRILAGQLNLSSDIGNDLISVIEPFVNFQKYIFIFDDLERCLIETSEILGYINNFVEQSNVKTIIVANEREIGKLKFSESLELKYLVAVLDKESDDSKHKSTTESIVKKINEPSVSPIKVKAEKIFNSNEQYRIIREKLIGHVINYSVDIKSIFKHLIDKQIKNDSVKELILAIQDRLYDLFDIKNCRNLRTIEAALRYVSDIYERLSQDMQNNEISQDCWNEVIMSCFWESIVYKAGDNPNNWSPDTYFMYENLSVPLRFFTLITFRFIENFVRYAAYSADFAVNSLRSYAIYQKTSSIKSDDTLSKLSNYYMQEDEVNEELIRELLSKLESDIYPANQFVKILALAYNLKFTGYDIQIDDFIKFMERCLEANAVDLQTYSAQMYDVPSMYKTEYFEKIDSLKNLNKTSQQLHSSNAIVSFLNRGRNWGEDLLRYVYENKDLIVNQNSFLAYVVPDVLINALEECSTEDFVNFRRAIDLIYIGYIRNGFFELDITNLSALYDYISTAKFPSKTKELQRVLLSNELKIELIKSNKLESPLV